MKTGARLLIAGLLILVITPSSPVVGQGRHGIAESEDNDTCSTANNIAINNLIEADIEVADPDYFKINVVSGNTYRFYTFDGHGGAVDVDMTIYNSNCTQTVAYDHGAGHPDICLIFTSDRTLTIKIIAYSAGTVGQYHLKVVPVNAPDVLLCTVSYYAQEQVSLYSLPNGMGQSLADAFTASGYTVDASLTARLYDAYYDPVVCYPAEDAWLTAVNSALAIIPDGMNIADGPANIAGEMFFSGPMFAGGHCQGLLVELTAGGTIPQQIPYWMNSADINADGIVNLTDVVMFSIDFFSAYNYRSDFHFDYSLDLSDIVYLAQAMNATWP